MAITFQADTISECPMLVQQLVHGLPISADSPIAHQLPVSDDGASETHIGRLVAGLFGVVTFMSGLIGYYMMGVFVTGITWTCVRDYC